MKKTVLLLTGIVLVGCGTGSKSDESKANTSNTSNTINTKNNTTSMAKESSTTTKSAKTGQSGTATFKNPSVGDTLIYKFTYENNVIKKMTTITSQELPEEVISNLPEGQKDAFFTQYVNAFKSQTPIPNSKVETKLEGNILTLSTTVDFDLSVYAAFAQKVGNLTDAQKNQADASQYITIELMEEQLKASGFERID
ncbi:MULTISPECIES: hypothetical protein [unclassified Granulicatella]|uniref:hypothetical protein n=1 Tax=unclassified Granulicatella TaxID=2630493 RepID=UPI0010736A55|nr:MULTISPECIES: hypothetical protein [unclassified Granulicatella]MBF0779694.1 hypothetical protein [Granulicatella sp. 19428wC4_WM01]TFU96216.1 hypothetical protein E4T68_01180 [Granulicatella sp. WM01]